MTFQENVRNKTAWQDTISSDKDRVPKLVIWDYRDHKTLDTFWFSDVHLGHHACREDHFLGNVEFVRREGIPCADLGDLVENATRDSIGAGVYEQEEITQSQIERAVEIYTPISKQIQSMQSGNHESVHRNSEVLTENGWKGVTEITKEDKLGQFDVKSGKITFVKPKSLIKHFAEELIWFESKDSKQAVTLNHDLVVDGKKVKAKHIKTLRQSQLRLSGNSFQEVDISLEDIELLTWVIMDGTILDFSKYNPCSNKVTIQFKLSREDKINHLKDLLYRLDIPYTIRKATMSGVNKLQPYLIRIYSDDARRINHLLNKKKQIPIEWRNLSEEQLLVFLKTLEQTDGGRVFKHINWVSTNKQDIDIIQEACVKNGIVSYQKRRGFSGFGGGKRQHLLNIFDKGITHDYKVKIKKKKYNDFAYCVEMPKGTIITRLDGKVAFTGNCRTFNQGGVNLTKIIARLLGVKYVGAGVMHLVRVGTQNYVGYSHHGASGATTVGGKFNALRRPMAFIDADFIVSGHLHDCLYNSMDSFYLDLRSRSIKKRTKHLIQNGAYLDWWNTYGQVKAYEPGTKGNAVIKFRGDRKEIDVDFR